MSTGTLRKDEVYTVTELKRRLGCSDKDINHMALAGVYFQYVGDTMLADGAEVIEYIFMRGRFDRDQGHEGFMTVAEMATKTEEDPSVLLRWIKRQDKYRNCITSFPSPSGSGQRVVGVHNIFADDLVADRIKVRGEKHSSYKVESLRDTRTKRERQGNSGSNSEASSRLEDQLAFFKWLEECN